MPLPPPPLKLADQVDPKALNVKASSHTGPRSADSSRSKNSVQAPKVAKFSEKNPKDIRKITAQKHLTPTTKSRDDQASSISNEGEKYSSPQMQDSKSAQIITQSASQSVGKASSKHSSSKVKKKSISSQKKLFVLDTNVLMHDPVCLFRFEEHDIFVPLITLEEMDAHKMGTTEVARNTRQASRYLDELVENSEQHNISAGIILSCTGHIEATGKLFFQSEPLDTVLPSSLPKSKADNQILGVVHALSIQHPDKQVVLVSKDINMRVKARVLGLLAEDYTNDKTLDDGDLLYTGVFELPSDFWEKHAKKMESWQEGSFTLYRISSPLASSLHVNQFVYLEAPGATPFYARVKEANGKSILLKTLDDYTNSKHSAWGINAKNREQKFALNLLMDPEIDFVSLAGQAGTGKTLITLAAGLTQVLDDRRYTEIIMTRVTVSVGEDIGFLPGTEEEKMGPWMGALDDNLEVLSKSETQAGEWGRAATNELVRNKIKIKSLNFMRGRTFLNKYLIIDEAQNLTPKQIKTLVTRAGPGTKIICMGNLAQIDTPYLTEGSSGLTYVVDRFKGWAHGGHVTLARGERSRLADFASEVL